MPQWYNGLRIHECNPLFSLAFVNVCMLNFIIPTLGPDIPQVLPVGTAPSHPYPLNKYGNMWTNVMTGMVTTRLGMEYSIPPTDKLNITSLTIHPWARGIHAAFRWQGNYPEIDWELGLPLFFNTVSPPPTALYTLPDCKEWNVKISKFLCKK